MKILILLILVVTLADFGKSEEAEVDPHEYANEKGECLKVGEFMNDCNNCKCSVVGQAPDCTVMHCSLSRQSEGSSEFLINL